MSETLKLGRVTLASTLGVGLLAAASCWSTAAAQHSKVLSPAKSPMTVQKLQQMSAQARVRTPQLKTLSANIGRMLANSAGSPLPSTDGSNGSAKTANNFGVGANQKNSVFHYSDAWVPSFNTVRHPYRQTGHFLFQASDGNFYRCTASMIARSVMVTAGHCVHDGGNRNAGWIQAGWFYPGRYSENGFPYGFAQTLSVHTTTGWFNTGKLDAGYDVAVAALDVRDGTTTQMGNFVGWYGWCRSGCLQNYWYMTQLGYPGN